MSAYLLIKCLHVLSGTVLFGTGIGIAFFRWSTDRSKEVRAIRIVAERTVLADWLFTTPAVLIQPVTGFALVRMAEFPLTSGWIVAAACLYLLAGMCWLPVLWLQWHMRHMARVADATGTPLPQRYRDYARLWFWLGVPAFAALLGVYWLMVAKPAWS
jgi:uncharacterized membrane protein